jgi:hypothetical protein
VTKEPSVIIKSHGRHLDYLNLPIEKYYPHVGALIKRAKTRGEVYCIVLDHYPDAVVEIMRAMVKAQPGGIVIHCYAGKDRTYFSQVSAADLGHHLAAIWQDANLEEHFRIQQPLWEEAEADLTSVFAGIEIDDFQEQFFGNFPYHLVAVPLANKAIEGWRAVGVANLRETFAVFISNEPYQSYGIDIVGLAQHEASHPILADIQRLYPDVPAQCVFVEQAYPPTNRFAREYGDPGYRWVEMVIRTSTYFYLHSLGLSEEAERYLRGEIEGGVTAIEVFVKALGPWWHERQKGRAAGLDKVLGELPSWLQKAVSELGT